MIDSKQQQNSVELFCAECAEPSISHEDPLGPIQKYSVIA